LDCLPQWFRVGAGVIALGRMPISAKIRVAHFSGFQLGVLAFAAVREAILRSLSNLQCIAEAVLTD
jgi:hypothetical protein